ncbi:MAG: hypothetical protein GY854_09635 [Deltaproteobacteria bacterium]|nr:hypothetical protein [Deltaproteobacteria bacterium]
MKRICHLNDISRDTVSSREGEDRESNTSGSHSGYELGLEVALMLLEQFRRLSSGTGTEMFFSTIRRLIHAEALIILEKADHEARILFTQLDVPEDVVNEVSAPGGFYFELARVRFTHVFDAGALEAGKRLPSRHPPLTNVIAVPICRDDGSSGSLVAAKQYDSSGFEQSDVMLLSVAAAVLSLGKRIS